MRLSFLFLSLSLAVRQEGLDTPSALNARTQPALLTTAGSINATSESAEVLPELPILLESAAQVEADASPHSQPDAKLVDPTEQRAAKHTAGSSPQPVVDRAPVLAPSHPSAADDTVEAEAVDAVELHYAVEPEPLGPPLPSPADTAEATETPSVMEEPPAARISLLPPVGTGDAVDPPPAMVERLAKRLASGWDPYGGASGGAMPGSEDDGGSSKVSMYFLLLVVLSSAIGFVLVFLLFILVRWIYRKCFTKDGEGAGESASSCFSCECAIIRCCECRLGRAVEPKPPTLFEAALDSAEEESIPEEFEWRAQQMAQRGYTGYQQLPAQGGIHQSAAAAALSSSNSIHAKQPAPGRPEGPAMDLHHPPAQIPPGWEKRTTSAGTVFYHNARRKISQWHVPES